MLWFIRSHLHGHLGLDESRPTHSVSVRHVAAPLHLGTPDGHLGTVPRAISTARSPTKSMNVQDPCDLGEPKRATRLSASDRGGGAVIEVGGHK